MAVKPIRFHVTGIVEAASGFSTAGVASPQPPFVVTMQAVEPIPGAAPTQFTTADIVGLVPGKNYEMQLTLAPDVVGV